MIRFILLDIEGTTTDIRFVHQVLFPYSAKHLPRYVQEHAQDPEVLDCLRQVQETVLAESGKAITQQEAVDILVEWIMADRKHTALKTLQGLVWKDGYERGIYLGQVYSDVPIWLKKWYEQGIGLGIYSSGSVFAQKLLFGYSNQGDLIPYFRHFFDTHVGGKKEVASYQTIATALALPPQEILFLSDVEEELDAAHQAGFQVIRVNREMEDVTSKYPVITRFDMVQDHYLGHSPQLI